MVQFILFDEQKVLVISDWIISLKLKPHPLLSQARAELNSVSQTQEPSSIPSPFVARLELT